MKNNFAIVKKPGKEYLDVVPNADLEKASWQHNKYSHTLEDLGLNVINIPTEKNYPSGCFTQDPFVVVGKTSLQTILGKESRKGEGESIHNIIKHFKKTKKMQSPATLEGGDVLITPKAIFIGISSRTNSAGVNQFTKVFAKENIPPVIAIPVENCLHLMTGATYIGKNIMLVSDKVDKKYFKDFKVINVPSEESYAANCMNFENIIVMPKGFPFTKKGVQKNGFEIVELEMSEFEKGNGGLTCLSLLFQ